MQVQLTANCARGPKGHVFEVIAQVATRHDDTYYIVEGLGEKSPDYSNDNSRFPSSDTIVYAKPGFTVADEDTSPRAEFQYEYPLLGHYTWLEGGQCRRVRINNNEDALSLLHP